MKVDSYGAVLFSEPQKKEFFWSEKKGWKGTKKVASENRRNLNDSTILFGLWFWYLFYRCEPAEHRIFWCHKALSNFWKLSVSQTICYVLVFRENVEGSLIGLVLYTKRAVFKRYPSWWHHVPKEQYQIANHDDHHQSTRSGQITQLILAEGKEVTFKLMHLGGKKGLRSEFCFVHECKVHNCRNKPGRR